MFSLAKWLGGLLMSLLLMLALAVLLLPRMIDPNDYRDDLEQLALEQTGRVLKLDGDLAISVFPWLGIHTEGLRLSQPEQIGGEMISVQRAQLRLKLIPLLSKRLEVDTVVLESPELRLITLNNGISSFTGLGDAEGQDTDPIQGDSDSLAPVALVIQGLSISDANLVWDDRSTGQNYELRDFNFESGNLLGDQLAPLELSGQVIDASSPQPIELALDGLAQINTLRSGLLLQDISASIQQAGQSMSLSFDQLVVAADSGMRLAALTLGIDAAMSGDDAQSTPVRIDSAVGALNYNPSNPGAPMSLRDVSADIRLPGRSLLVTSAAATIKLDDGSAEVPALGVVSDDLNLQLTELRVRSLFDQPALSGKLKLPAFDVNQLLEDLQIDYQPSQRTALSAVGIRSAFKASSQRIELDDLQLSLDQSKLIGELAIADFADPGIDFNFTLDQLNLDDYLPAPSKSDSASELEGATALAVPMAALKDINANGRFRADSLISGGLQLNDIDVQVNSSNGNLTVTPTAKLYDGTMAGKLDFTESAAGDTLRIQHEIDLVSLAKLLTAAEVTDQLSGIGALGLDLTVVDKGGVQSNSGTIKLLAKNGTIKGIDIKKMLDQGYASYKKLRGRDQDGTEPEQVSDVEPPAEDGRNKISDETGFAELAGTFALNDFVLSNNDFMLRAPLFRISGEGQIDIAAQTLNYLLRVSVVNSTAGQGGETVDKLRGITIPIRLNGDLQAPRYSLDMRALYQGLVKKELDDKKAEYLEEKLGIEDARDLSTKEVLQRALIERLNRKSKREQTERAEPVPYEQTGEAADGSQGSTGRSSEPVPYEQTGESSDASQPDAGQSSKPVPYEQTSSEPGPDNDGRAPDVFADPAYQDADQATNDPDVESADSEEEAKSPEEQLKEDLQRKLLESIFK